MLSIRERLNIYNSMTTVQTSFAKQDVMILSTAVVNNEALNSTSLHITHNVVLFKKIIHFHL